MATAASNPSIACLVCSAIATPGDHYCAECGALLPDPVVMPRHTQLDLEQLFQHEGRLDRREYLLTAVVLSLFLFVALGLFAALRETLFGALLGAALVAAAAFALTCATIKRLHDFDTGGWIAVVCLVPVIGWLVMLIFAVIPSTHGQNAYGLPQDGSLRAPSS